MNTFYTLAAGAALAASLLAGSTAYASGLTAVQVQAIVGLMQSFGADASTITNVQAALTGTAPSAPALDNIDSMFRGEANPNTLGCAALTHSFGQGATDAKTGGDVSRLQQALGGEVTGYFGPVTLGLLEQWQASHGIVSSGSPSTTGYGYVGPHTRAALACTAGQTSYSAPSYTPPTTPVPSSNPNYSALRYAAAFGSTTTDAATSGESALSNMASQPLPSDPLTASIDKITVSSALTPSMLTGRARGTAALTVVLSQNNATVYTKTGVAVLGGLWSMPVPASVTSGTFTIDVLDQASGRVLARGTLTLTPAQ